MRLFIGNIKFDATEQALEEILHPYSPEAGSIHICTDRDTGQSRGFGFADVALGEQAIHDLNGVMWLGRELQVNEARPQARNGKSGRRQRE